ncbi:MAG: TIGR03663 family protein, partial [Anaerolineae bacterium]|nr:TIGR03663 family protein [Anaerolineae bacterium]
MSDKIQDEKASLLDRPVFSGFKLTWWTVIYVLLIALVVFTRLWDLSSRAYSHDESIHAWESWKLVTGQGYQHSPVYHGPFLYHFTALIFALFGHNDYSARLGAASFAILLVILPILLRKELGKKGVLITTLLMAISPVMMHRGRFIRHDIFALVPNMILLIAMLRYLERREAKHLYWIAAAMSLSLCGKETTFITFFIFGTFLFIWFAMQWLRDRSRALRDFAVLDVMVVIATLILPTATAFPVKLLGGDPVDYSQNGIIFSGAVFLVLLAISVVIGALWNWRRWIICAAIFYGIFIPLFTTMFTNGQGFATGMVGQLGYWLSQQEVKRGGQPWYYYLVLMPMYEFLPLLMGLGGTIYYLVRGREHREEAEPGTAPQASSFPFIALLIYWFCLAFAMYSWAGEKMPWLTQHLALPLHLLAGWTGARLLEADWREIRERGGLWLLLLMPLFIYTLARMLGHSPFSGTGTEELNRSMAWIAALVVAVVLAVAISRIAGRLRGKEVWRLFALSLLVILLALTVRFAWMASFINADLVTEFLVYAQGAPDVAFVTREIETLSRRLTGGLHLKVAYDDDSSWPFVWYLRNFDNAQFYGKKPAGPFDAEVVIVGSANESAVKPFLG